MGIVIITIAVLVIIGLTYLLNQKPKLAMAALIGICSIGAFFPLIPLFAIFSHGEEMSLAKYVPSIATTVTYYAVALIICAIAYLVLAFLCVTSIIKISKSTVRGANLKIVNRTFFTSVLVSSVTLLTMLFSTITEAAFGKRIIEFMFSNWDKPEQMITLEVICSFLVLLFGIPSVVLCKIDQNVKLDDTPKKLSNHLFLSITCLVLLLVSLLPIYNTLVHLHIFASFAGVVMFSLTFFAAIINSASNPEKALKILKNIFYIIVPVAAIILIDNLFIGLTPFILLSLLALGLAALGLFLVKKSQIVGVVEQNAKNVQAREAPQKTIGTINEGVMTGVKTSTEFAKKNAPVVKEFMQKIVAVYKSVLPRVKGIFFNPKIEYQIIATENKPATAIFTSYVLPLAALVAFAAFIGWGFIGYSYNGQHYRIVGDGFKMAIAQFILMAGCIFSTASVIYVIAENFNSQKNFDKAFSLVSYASTPSLIGALSHLIPKISWIALILSLYSFYLLFLGLKPMLHTSEEKKTSFSIIGILTLIVVSLVTQRLIRVILNIDVFDSLVW